MTNFVTYWKGKPIMITLYALVVAAATMWAASASAQTPTVDPGSSEVITEAMKQSPWAVVIVTVLLVGGQLMGGLKAWAESRKLDNDALSKRKKELETELDIERDRRVAAEYAAKLAEARLTDHLQKVT